LVDNDDIDFESAISLGLAVVHVGAPEDIKMIIAE
jgi:hypothetical protein